MSILEEVSFFGDKGNRYAVVKKAASDYLVEFYSKHQFLGASRAYDEVQAEQMATMFAFEGTKQQLLNE